MFGSGILEVAIGIIFIYLLVSLLCSAVREGIEAWTKTRAAYLEYGIRELLHDADPPFRLPYMTEVYFGFAVER